MKIIIYSAIFKRRFPANPPSNVHLLCAWNDLETQEPATVINQYDALIKEVRYICPSSRIILSRIPPRGIDAKLLNKIEKVNTYLSNAGQKENMTYFGRCPTMFKHYQEDEIHFNEAGAQLYANRLGQLTKNFTLNDRNVKE